MRSWTPRGVPPARLKIPTNASRGTGQYLQLRPDDSVHMVYADRRLCSRLRGPRLLIPGVGVKCAVPGLSRSGGAWACWIWCCARAPGLTLVHDPRVGSGVGDEMFDGVIPLGEALRPLDLSRPSTRVACRQRGFGSRPRRIGVSEGLTRAKGRCKVVVVVDSSGRAGARCHTAQPKPGSSSQGIFRLVGCRRLGAGRAAP
jgi:hypothetical protein